MSKFIRNVSFLSIIFMIVLSACNLPSGTQTEEPNVVFTQAALTVEAQLTQSAAFNTPTLPPSPPPATATNTAVSIPTITPTSIPPSPTATCDLAQFVRDVTVPDGTLFAPGTAFTKTWRLKNVGTCTWSGYSLVFDSGDAMGGTSPIPIGTVNPGQEVDLSVNLTAPSTNGSYRGYWRIRNAAGVLIPVLNGYQGKSFFVDIKVGVISSGFDFHTKAPLATWVSGAGNITFGGPDTDPNGFVMYRDGARVEDGTTPAKVLETHPQWVDDGVLTGRYPAYTVVAGEHFTAKIGFLAFPDGSCGAGNVKFQLNYREAGVLKNLGEWVETCDGTLRSLDIDLSPLAGKTVEFVLAVLANGSSGQDWAVWINPEIRVP
ncbi:MAG TPA: NBR1-Ig-like domain-containing protein [Anaerolineales bacterium]|nr:NBR1-Ig-like domain-containing protein [Anaerolineales bacterium]